MALFDDDDGAWLALNQSFIAVAVAASVATTSLAAQTTRAINSQQDEWSSALSNGWTKQFSGSPQWPATRRSIRIDQRYYNENDYFIPPPTLLEDPYEAPQPKVRRIIDLTVHWDEAVGLLTAPPPAFDELRNVPDTFVVPPVKNLLVFQEEDPYPPGPGPTSLTEEYWYIESAAKEIIAIPPDPVEDGFSAPQPTGTGNTPAIFPHPFAQRADNRPRIQYSYYDEFVVPVITNAFESDWTPPPVQPAVVNRQVFQTQDDLQQIDSTGILGDHEKPFTHWIPDPVNLQVYQEQDEIPSQTPSIAVDEGEWDPFRVKPVVAFPPDPETEALFTPISIDEGEWEPFRVKPVIAFPSDPVDETVPGPLAPTFGNTGVTRPDLWPAAKTTLRIQQFYSDEFVLQIPIAVDEGTWETPRIQPPTRAFPPDYHQDEVGTPPIPIHVDESDWTPPYVPTPTLNLRFAQDTDEVVPEAAPTFVDEDNQPVPLASKPIVAFPPAPFTEELIFLPISVDDGSDWSPPFVARSDTWIPVPWLFHRGSEQTALPSNPEDHWYSEGTLYSVPKKPVQPPPPDEELFVPQPVPIQVREDQWEPPLPPIVFKPAPFVYVDNVEVLPPPPLGIDEGVWFAPPPIVYQPQPSVSVDQEEMASIPPAYEEIYIPPAPIVYQPQPFVYVDTVEILPPPPLGIDEGVWFPPPPLTYKPIPLAIESEEVIQPTSTEVIEFEDWERPPSQPPIVNRTVFQWQDEIGTPPVPLHVDEEDRHIPLQVCVNHATVLNPWEFDEMFGFIKFQGTHTWIKMVPGRTRINNIVGRTWIEIIKLLTGITPLS